MNMKQFVYHETRKWLEAEDPDLPRPKPPEGMHELALEEWWDAYNTAVADYEIEEAQLDQITADVKRILKTAAIGLAVYGLYLTGNPYVYVTGGVIGLVTLVRMK